MGKQLTSAALDTLCELQALRMLVENMLTVLPLAKQMEAVDGFRQSAEASAAALLAGPHRDELLSAMDRAVDKQLARIGEQPLQPLP